MSLSTRTLIALASLGALLTACDGEQDIDGVGASATATVTVESAYMSRCNQMMSFAELWFTFTIENTSDEPIALGAVAFDGTSANGGATYATGEVGMIAPVTLPVGGSARFRCAPDVPLTWSEGGASGAMALSVAISAVGGGHTGLAEGADGLEFIEAWDSCDTYASDPYPCEPVPMN